MPCIYSAYTFRQVLEGKAYVAKKEKKKKDSQLVLRLDKAERDAFIDRCSELDTTAAREIRQFIRDFMDRNGDGAEGADKEPEE